MLDGIAREMEESSARINVLVRVGTVPRGRKTARGRNGPRQERA
jgi:hypothetical protein